MFVVHAKAFRLDVKKAAEAAIKDGLRFPKQASDGRYNTLNNRGAMFPVIREIDKKFIEIAKQPEKKVLEIGVAYGHVCKEALRQGATHYVAIDVEEKHLRILATQIMQEMPEKERAVSLICGAFPEKEVIEELELNSYDAILAAYVLHFLTKEEVEEAFRQFARLLKPGGKLLALMNTPYVGFAKQSVVEALEQDLSAFQLCALKVEEGENTKVELPGFIKDVRASVDVKKMSEEAMEAIALTRDHVFLFFEEVVKYLLKKDFEIEQCNYEAMAGVSGVWANDGRESLIVIAQKRNN